MNPSSLALVVSPMRGVALNAEPPQASASDIAPALGGNGAQSPQPAGQSMQPSVQLQQGQSNALHEDHEWKMAAMQVFARMPNYQVAVSDFRLMAHELDAHELDPVVFPNANMTDVEASVIMQKITGKWPSTMVVTCHEKGEAMRVMGVKGWVLACEQKVRQLQYDLMMHRLTRVATRP